MVKKGCSNVPIELIQYAHKHKMQKALGLYLLLNVCCDGHLELTNERRTSLMTLLNIKDTRSFSRYLLTLKKENWIGHDVKKNVYYIRSSRKLRKRYGFYKSTAVVFNVCQDAPNIVAFIEGAIIGHEIRRRAIARKGRIIKLAGSSALQRESALQELAASGKISEYIGLSLSVMVKLLGVSKSQADRIKTKLVACGYLSINPKFKVIHVGDEPDFSLIKFLRSDRRYSVKKKVKSGKAVYEFRERTYDEMFSLMTFKNQKVLVRDLQRV